MSSFSFSKIGVSFFKQLWFGVFLVGLLASISSLVPLRVFAGDESSMNGYVWSSTIGWISLNSNNPGSGGGSNFGVNKENDGRLVGYAWSSNVGWVKFGNLSGFPTVTGSVAEDARLTGSTLTGWARACAGMSNPVDCVDVPVQASVPAQTSSVPRAWYSVTSSSDGTKLAAVVLGGSIYTSTDSGATWTERTSAGQRLWRSITSSADGTKLAAVFSASGSIYTSTDSGATWTERTSAGQRNWFSITSSADGTKLAAVNQFGYIYTSTDSGATWTQRGFADGWFSITSSLDGIKLAAARGGPDGYVYTSINNGVSWVPQVNSGPHNFISITSSSDGTKLAAATFGVGYIYTSTDSGATWTQRTSAGQRNWFSITSSSDGTKLAAVEVGANPAMGTIGYIYTSTDSGATWTQRTSSGERNWTGITSSADGTKLSASASLAGVDGFIYTSTDSGATWTKRDPQVPTTVPSTIPGADIDPRGGWDGWISLKGASYGITKVGSVLSGFAWGSEVFGWLDFSRVSVTPDLTISVFINGRSSSALLASPVVFEQGTQLQLTWDSTGGQNRVCTRVVGAGTSQGATQSGEISLGALPVGTYQHTVTCKPTTTSLQSSSDRVDFSVVARPVPSLNLTVDGSNAPVTNPRVILSGTNVTIAWTTTNVTSCIATASQNNGTASWRTGTIAIPSGSMSIGPLSVATTFTLLCTNASGDSVGDTVSVAIAPLGDILVKHVGPGLSLLTGESVSSRVDGGLSQATNPATFVNVSDGMHTVSVAPIAGKDVFVSTCSYARGASECVVSDIIPTFIPADCSNTECTYPDAFVVNNEVTKVVFKYVPVLQVSCSASTASTLTDTNVTWTASVSGGAGAYTYFWLGDDSLSGFNSSVTKSYTGSGTKNASVRVTSGPDILTVPCSGSVAVTDPEVPQVTLSTSPNPIASGASSMLTWTIARADSCYLKNLSTGASSGIPPTSGSQITGALTSDTSYEVGCTNVGLNKQTAGVTVSIDIPAPTITFYPESAEVAYNASTRLVWATSNATACTAGWLSGASVPVQSSGATSVHKAIGPLTIGTTYSITCTGPGGTNSAGTSVNIVGGPDVTFSVTAGAVTGTSVRIVSGTGATLNWTIANATTCSLKKYQPPASTPINTTSVSITSTSQSTGNLTLDTLYELSCTNGTNESVASVMVNVDPEPQIIRFEADPSNVAYDGSTRLVWETASVSSCSGFGDWTGSKQISDLGNPERSQTIQNIQDTKTYGLRCLGVSGGSTEATVRVTVGDAPGALLIQRVGTDGAIASVPTDTYTKIDSQFATANNPESQVISLGAHSASVTQLRDYVVTAGSCLYTTGGTSCSPSLSSGFFGFSCNGTECTLSNVSVEAGKTRKATFKYTPIAPTVDLRINDKNSTDTINAGGVPNLTWTSDHTTSCSSTSFATGGAIQNTGGVGLVGLAEGTHNYTITCSGIDGTTTSDSVSVVVVGLPPNPNAVLYVNGGIAPVFVDKNEGVTLTWSSTGAAICVSSTLGFSTGDATSNTLGVAASITASKIFTIRCTALSGIYADASVTVNLNDEPNSPTISFEAVDINGRHSANGRLDNAPYQQPVSLRWYTTNADSCTASGDWSGPKSRSDAGGSIQSESTVNLTSPKTYVLTCQATAGGVTKVSEANVVINVQQPAVPAITLSASPANILTGSQSTLSWTINNADVCSLKNHATGISESVAAVPGSQSTGNLSTDTTYSLACTNQGLHERIESVTVGVTTPGEPTLTLATDSALVPYDGTAYISWTSTNATSCTASGDWTIPVPVALQKSATSPFEVRNMIVAKTFILTCTGLGGSVQKSVSVDVDTAPQPEVSISADPDAVNSANLTYAADGATTLTWSSRNATSCSLYDTDAPGTVLSSNLGNPVSSVNITGILTETTFRIDCINVIGGVTVGQTSDAVTITVNSVGDPVLAFSARQENDNNNRSIDGKLTIPIGNEIKLYWNALHVETCTASTFPQPLGLWNGPRVLSNIFPLVHLSGSLIQNYVFTLSCVNRYGTEIVRSIAVSVAHGPRSLPEVSFGATPAEIDPNTTSDLSTRLSWTVSGAYVGACTLVNTTRGIILKSGFGDGSDSLVTPVDRETLYTLSCQGSGGVRIGEARVSLKSVIPTPDVNAYINGAKTLFISSSGTIPLTLTWTATDGANSCSISETASGGVPVVIEPTQVYPTVTSYIITTPIASRTYTVTCSNPNNRVGTGAATINVLPPPPTITGFSATPGSPTVDQTFVLNWTVTNPLGANQLSCIGTGSGFSGGGTYNSGNRTLTGTSPAIGPLSQGIFQYTLSCTNEGGTVTTNLPVTVTKTVCPSTISRGALCLVWSNQNVNQSALINIKTVSSASACPVAILKTECRYSCNTGAIVSGAGTRCAANPTFEEF